MRVTKKQIRLAVTIIALLIAALLSASKQDTMIAVTGDKTISVAAAADTDVWHVTKVIDGDTIDAANDGADTKVRIIGINTPETVDPRRAVQCFGKEASARAHELLDGKEVRLVADPSQDDLDKYGRSLRFVTLADGSDYGLAMIRGGYAHEYTYKTPHAKQAEYRAAEQEAREAKRGLWAADTCAGDTTKAAQ